MSLRWLDTEFHTSFRTSGSLHKPSRDFSMLAWPFAMLYCFAVYFCMTRVTCSHQLGVIAWHEQIADTNKNSIFLNSDLCWNFAYCTSYYYKNLPIDKKLIKTASSVSMPNQKKKYYSTHIHRCFSNINWKYKVLVCQMVYAAFFI